jgi:hypothetical protein
MDRLWVGIGIGLSVLLIPGGSIILLAWLCRGDGTRYSVRCLTCGSQSGDCRFEWTANRWARRHAEKSPICAKRAMNGNRKVMR